MPVDLQDIEAAFTRVLPVEHSDTVEKNLQHIVALLLLDIAIVLRESRDLLNLIAQKAPPPFP